MVRLQCCRNADRSARNSQPSFRCDAAHGDIRAADDRRRTVRCTDLHVVIPTGEHVIGPVRGVVPIKSPGPAVPTYRDSVRHCQGIRQDNGGAVDRRKHSLIDNKPGPPDGQYATSDVGLDRTLVENRAKRRVVVHKSRLATDQYARRNRQRGRVVVTQLIAGIPAKHHRRVARQYLRDGTAVAKVNLSDC